MRVLLAVPHAQSSQRRPSTRLNSLRLLVRCARLHLRLVTLTEIDAGGGEEVVPEGGGYWKYIALNLNVRSINGRQTAR